MPIRVVPTHSWLNRLISTSSSMSQMPFKDIGSGPAKHRRWSGLPVGKTHSVRPIAAHYKPEEAPARRGLNPAWPIRISNTGHNFLAAKHSCCIVRLSLRNKDHGS